MMLEAGKSYRTRDGSVVGPMVEVFDPAHQGRTFRWAEQGTTRTFWRDDGKAVVSSSPYRVYLVWPDQALDIIESFDR